MSLYPDIKSILREKGVDYLGMGHRTRRHLFKREKRRLRRQAAARRKSDLCQQDSVFSESVRSLDAALTSLKEEESRLQGYEWEAREREFLSQLDRKCEESRVVREPEKREPTKQPVSTPPALTHLPFSPYSDTPVQIHTSISECYFFQKTGACKFGDNCRNLHPRPSISSSLLFPHLFSGAGVNTCMVDGREQDVELENDDIEVYQRFSDFYEDVYPEVGKCGQVLRFEVCANQEWHLRGNVFVQFSTPEGARRCKDRMNGRWYDRRLVNCEFSCVRDFGQAVCQVETAGRLSQSRKYKVCLKGKSCNFWHVFRKAD